MYIVLPNWSYELAFNIQTYPDKKINWILPNVHAQARKSNISEETIRKEILKYVRILYHFTERNLRKGD